MTWRTALRLGRVSNLPTVWTNVIAGLALADVSPGAATLAWLIPAFSCFYTGGMYLNDAFDHERDRIERPERPIPSGEASPASVFAVGFLLLGVGLLLLAGAGWTLEPRTTWRPLLAGAGLAAAIVYYDADHQHNRLAPLVMGLCRGLVYVGAACAVVGTPPPTVLWGAAALVSYIVGVTAVARQETLKRLESAWPLLLLAAPFVYGLMQGAASPFTWIALAAFALWTLRALRRLFQRTLPGAIPAAVGSLLAGIALLDALFVAGSGQPVWAGVAVAGFALARLLQRHVPPT